MPTKLFNLLAEGLLLLENLLKDFWCSKGIIISEILIRIKSNLKNIRR